MPGCVSTRNTVVKQEDKRAGAPSDTLLTTLLRQHPQYFDTILQHNDRWRIQIVYTQIDRRISGRLRFTHHYFNTDSGLYFYPASTVKLPVAVLALQRLNELQIQGLDKFSTMITDAADSSQTGVYNDPTAADGRASIAHYIKKIFLVSDNDAFNRLYEFLGQEYINQNLQRMGWYSVQIVHRLNMTHFTEHQNRLTNPVTFYDSAAKPIYHKPAQESQMVYQQRYNKLGAVHYEGDSLLQQPFDFSKKNRLPLPALHDMLLRVIFPKSVPRRERFNVTEDDYRFLYRYMSMEPQASDYPQYDSTYNDSYSRFLFYGSHDALQPGIRIFNKEGDAYGFLTDAAYIIDTTNGVEFLLSATINCNDSAYNADAYPLYETVGLPFLRNLGRVVYDYERSLPRRRAPSFIRF